MPKLTIDNKEIECRAGVSVLEAALTAGWDIPHFCFHPGLSVVASCRLCLMEIQMPHPKTQEMGWSPKLVPACQTPVRDGLVVRFNSERVKKSQRQCMEFFLLNHPLDCPVCDQAGECFLQDYSYRFGHAESRMVEQKHVTPKKDIGPRTLLYSDRCITCTRCVRFTREISGTNELCLTNRGWKSEIDVMPGLPLDNPMQGNVVDICPVGCLLDKDFLFKQRVWLLESTPSVCPGCAVGCAIDVDHNDGVVYRLKPRYNPGVNDWWMCDDGRFGYKYVRDADRITTPIVRRGRNVETPRSEDLAGMLRFRFERHVEVHGGEQVVGMLSPWMACEEAFLLIRFLRGLAPDCALAIGSVPTEGAEQLFPVGASGDDVKFRILPEKCPNRRGIEMLLKWAGGTTLGFGEFVERSAAGGFSAGWIAGGYPESWVDKTTAKIAGQFELLVVQDMFANGLTDGATIVLPACAWVERSGSFVNAGGRIQPFDRAIRPPDGARQDGQLLFELAGFEGLYDGERVREMMAAEMPEFADVQPAVPAPLVT